MKKNCKKQAPYIGVLFLVITLLFPWLVAAQQPADKISAGPVNTVGKPPKKKLIKEKTPEKKASTKTERAVATRISRESLASESRHQQPRGLQRSSTSKAKQGKAELMTPGMLVTKTVDPPQLSSDMPGANQPSDIGYAVSPFLLEKPMPGATPGMGTGTALSVPTPTTDPNQPQADSQ